jgi:hypothetical protein
LKTIAVWLKGKLVEIRFPDGWQGDIELLFGRHASARPITVLDVIEEANDRWAIRENGDTPIASLDRPSALIQLSELAASRLAGAVTDGVALHAGVVARDGCAVLLPGLSGTGKSSLVAWLVDRGFGYCTDELAALSGDATLSCFTRALILKDGGAVALASLPGLRNMPSARIGTHLALRPGAAAGTAMADEVSCRLILFPTFRAGAEFTLEPLTPARAAADLMASNVNAANLADGGLSALSALARRVPALRLVYGAFDQLDGIADMLAGLALDQGIDGGRLRKLLLSVRSAATPAASPTVRYEIPAPTPRRNAAALTIGMATYDDYDGVYFSLQALRLYHPEIVDQAEFIVVDNHPDGACATALKALENDIPNYRYVPEQERKGTFAKGRVFDEAAGDFVLCMDSHVFLVPEALTKLLGYFAGNPGSRDLLQGPLLYDNLAKVSTHFRPEWSGGMFGVWDNNGLADDPEGPPFEIPMQGMGLFACRRDAWPGFNPSFRGFGGEEWYIHEKIRRNGGRVLCMPFLRWVHRFKRPQGIPYRNTFEDRIWNYLVGFRELGLPTAEMEAHFRELIGEPKAGSIIAQLNAELRRLGN